jgi:type IV fimbrial biogenesis protein FimT
LLLCGGRLRYNTADIAVAGMEFAFVPLGAFNRKIEREERGAMMKRIKKYAKDRAGFSFSELMIVMAMVAVLSAIAVPSILRGLPEKRLKAAARNLYADMQRARLLAVKQNKSIKVIFDTAVSPGYYYFDDNGNAKWDTGEFRRNLSDQGGVDYGSGKAAKKWDGNPFTSLATNITFKFKGTADQGTTYLHNQGKDVCYAVTTTEFGNIKIRRFNGTSWDEK